MSEGVAPLTFARPNVVQVQLVSLLGSLQGALGGKEMAGGVIGLVVGATDLQEGEMQGERQGEPPNKMFSLFPGLGNGSFFTTRWGPATLTLPPCVAISGKAHVGPSLPWAPKQMLPSPSRRRQWWQGSWRGPGTHTWGSCCHPPHTPCHACSGGSGRGLQQEGNKVRASHVCTSHEVLRAPQHRGNTETLPKTAPSIYSCTGKI